MVQQGRIHVSKDRAYAGHHTQDRPKFGKGQGFHRFHRPAHLTEEYYDDAQLEALRRHPASQSASLLVQI